MITPNWSPRENTVFAQGRLRLMALESSIPLLIQTKHGSYELLAQTLTIFRDITLGSMTRYLAKPRNNLKNPCEIESDLIPQRDGT